MFAVSPFPISIIQSFIDIVKFLYKLEKIGKTLNNKPSSRRSPMETSNMKNMVVLKNLPSNLVEEAIVILKSNKKAKKLEKIEKKSKAGKVAKPIKKDYILTEAEMLISSYIAKIENENKQKKHYIIKKSKSNKRLKTYAILTSIIIFAQTILLILK